jgi:hypothetical protein
MKATLAVSAHQALVGNVSAMRPGVTNVTLLLSYHLALNTESSNRAVTSPRYPMLPLTHTRLSLAESHSLTVVNTRGTLGSTPFVILATVQLAIVLFCAHNTIQTEKYSRRVGRSSFWGFPVHLKLEESAAAAFVNWTACFPETARLSPRHRVRHHGYPAALNAVAVHVPPSPRATACSDLSTPHGLIQPQARKCPTSCPRVASCSCTKHSSPRPA